MTEQSNVALEQAICPVCCTTFDTGSVLIHRNLNAKLNRHETTHWELCPEHHELHEAGYVALVEAEPPEGKTSLTLGEARRTGRILHARRDVLETITQGMDVHRPMLFIGPEAFNVLLAMSAPNSDRPN